MTLGGKLAKLRKENHYTQEQLAGMLGVSRQAVSKWESDITYPETEKLLKLGALYHCSMDYLLKDITSAGEDTVPANRKTVSLSLNRRCIRRGAVCRLFFHRSRGNWQISCDRRSSQRTDRIGRHQSSQERLSNCRRTCGSRTFNGKEAVG